LIKDGDEKGWFEGEGTRGGGGRGGGEAEWEERGGDRIEFEGLVRDEQEDGVKAKRRRGQKEAKKDCLKKDTKRRDKA
jgi:hypothetical protein